MHETTIQIHDRIEAEKCLRDWLTRNGRASLCDVFPQTLEPADPQNERWRFVIINGKTTHFFIVDRNGDVDEVD